MVSKRIECASCNKKCSGNVLRYQDQYYHKLCFESEQKNAAEDSNLAQSIYNHETNSQNTIDSQKASSNLNDTVDYSPILRSSEQQVRSTSIGSKGENYFSSSSSLSKITTTKTTTHQQTRSSTSPTQMNHNNTNSNAASEATSSRNASNRLSSADQRRNSHHSEPANGRGMSKSATLPHPSTMNQRNGLVEGDERQSQQQQFTRCAGCKDFIKDSEALKALDRHWHVWCFKCTKCKSLLHGEYVVKDDKPYCEKDYQKLFGVTCVYCKRYITGKVLQAGEAHHFHPSCARCSKCGDPFVPGEEMYLQGEITWHPRCGPGPESNIDDIALNDISARGSQVSEIKCKNFLCSTSSWPQPL